MIGSTLKRLGCCGVLVWLAIAGTFATFFIGEYLERPEEDKTFWKAGVQVPALCLFVITHQSVNDTFYFLGDLLRRVNSRDRCRADSLHIPDSE